MNCQNLTQGEIEEVDELLKYSGYTTSGRQIVPVRHDDNIPTVVGYKMEDGIVVRKSKFNFEQSQIDKFRRDMERKGIEFRLE